MAFQGVSVPTTSDGQVVSNRDVRPQQMWQLYKISVPVLLSFFDAMYPTVVYLIACY